VEWVIIEWPEGKGKPSKYWLSTVPETIGFKSLVDHAKLRWRIERDYQELKQEIGLSHFEGRGGRGFHHHAVLCIAAYGFLICERETIPSLRTLLQPQTPVVCNFRAPTTPRRRHYGQRNTWRAQ
jgi:SRSO17 transposase